MRPHVVDFLARFIGEDAARLLAPRYFTMVAIAGLVVSWLMLRDARRRGLDRMALLDALLIGYVGCVVGGIVFPILLDVAGQVLDGRVPRVRWAGMVAYGGFFGGFFGALWGLSRRRTLSVGQFGDLIAAPLGLAVAIVRTGCFIAGCDYGKVTSVPWAVRFPAGSPGWQDHVNAGWVPAWRGESLPVHPTQLYESLVGVAIFVGVTVWARRSAARRASAAPGGLFLGAIAAYAVGRFGVEMLRGDASRGFAGALSTSQVIGLLVLFAVGVAVLLRRRRALAVAAAAVLCLAFVGPARAQTPPQPEPMDPYAQPAPPPAPRPAPRPVPPPPYGGNIPPPVPTPATPVIPASAGTTIVEQPFPVSRFEVALMVASTTAITRPERQVPSLWGAAVMGTVAVHHSLRVGLEGEGTTSKLAAHRTFLALVAYRLGNSRQLGFYSRLSAGVTQIDFIDPSFADVFALDVRLAGGAELALGRRVKIFAEPLSVDFLSSKNLGVPIWSWQITAGASFGWGD